jgi:hypothetical protein
LRVQSGSSSDSCVSRTRSLSSTRNMAQQMTQYEASWTLYRSFLRRAFRFFHSCLPGGRACGYGHRSLRWARSGDFCLLGTPFFLDRVVLQHQDGIFPMPSLPPSVRNTLESELRSIHRQVSSLRPEEVCYSVKVWVAPVQKCGDAFPITRSPDHRITRSCSVKIAAAQKEPARLALELAA